MADSCIISKEQLSSKEQALKQKLYGNTGQTSTMNQRTKGQPSQMQSQGLQPQTIRASPQRVMEHHKTQLGEVTDHKMETFIDEMRCQFINTQSANAIPQNILYQQTRTMEKQVSLLEENQKTMGDIINNLMNNDGSGPNTSANLKQQVFNDNRRMLLEMMIPFNQQLNDMKLLYENTKSTSSDLGNKIDDLKKIFSNQSMSLGGASMASSANPFNNNMMVQEGMMDPSIMRKGLDDIKEQMRDVQREAILIENDMEKRRNDMILKEYTQKHLPQTITEEFNQFQTQLKTGSLEDHLKNMPTVSQTRQAVYHKLGGQFDYGSFVEDLRLIIQEKDQVDREFKAQQLWAPDFKGEKKFGKYTYDFSTKPLVDEMNMKPAQQKESAVSHIKPLHYQGIQTEPKFIIDKDIIMPQAQGRPEEKSMSDNRPLASFITQNQTQKQQYLQQPKSSGGRQTYSQKSVNDNVSRRNDIEQSYDQLGSSSQDFRKFEAERKHSPSMKKDLTNVDILQLKKQVIEEIKNELSMNKGLSIIPTDPQITENQKYKDQRDEQTMKIIGGKSKDQEEDDLQAQIMTDLQKTKIQLDLEREKGASLRQSTQSLMSNPQLTESQVLNTVADVILQQMQQPSSKMNDSMTSQELNKLGEQAIIDKINDIFNEVARDARGNIQTEESQALSSRRVNFQGKQDFMNTSVQVLEQSLMDNDRKEPRRSGRAQEETQNNAQSQQPMVIPIVINQQNTQGNVGGIDYSRNPNQLRDMIQQAISAQLSLHNIKKDRENMDQDPFNQTSRTLEEEEAKTRLEQQLLRKQIPINVHPYVSQTINQGPQKSYQNPFMIGPAANSANQFGIQPPLINDLNQFNLDSESSSDFLSMESSQYSNMFSRKADRSRSRGKARYSKLQESQRSEGEIGRVDSDDDPSLGEILVAGISKSNKKSSPQKAGQIQLGQTYNYEEDKIPEDIVDKPIYESSEGPIPKGKKMGGMRKKQPSGKSGANILNSGESFGVNPLRSIKAGGMGESKNFKQRQQIDDNFLEEEDDYQSSKMSESGEIDPKLFA